MDPLSDITIISCLYGASHDDYLSDWLAAVGRLDPAPREVIIGTDRYRHLTSVYEVSRRRQNRSSYPQAFHLTSALNEVQTEWVWIHDIDDLAFSDALEGIENAEADVVQCGYERSDGEVYIPPGLTEMEFMPLNHNPFVAGSFVRTDMLLDAGGFPDVALQDWALWRTLARMGAIFAGGDRPRFKYMRHARTRGSTELTAAERRKHMVEMWRWEDKRAVA
jgi:hypothetical protein